MPTCASPWTTALRAPTVAVTPPLATGFTPSGAQRPASEPLFGYLRPPYTKGQPIVSPLVAQIQQPVTTFGSTTMFSQTPSFTPGSQSTISSRQAGPSRVASTSAAQHSKAVVLLSETESQFASQSTPIPQPCPWHESEVFQTTATVNYPQSFTDFLRGFATSEGEGFPILHVRQRLAAISHMGFTLDEHLPVAERPKQRDLSTFAYLQIAADVS